MPLIKLNATLGLTGSLPAVSGANLTGVSAGKILQVVQANFRTPWSQTVNGMGVTVNTGSEDFDIAITPSATSSKIHLTFCIGRLTGHTSSSGYGTAFSIARGGTEITDSESDTNYERTTFFHGTDSLAYASGIMFSYLDSPSTTSETTYSLKCYPHSTGGYNVQFGNYYTSVNDNQGYQASASSRIIAMEVEG
tara:strand:- start:253 stop:834 length:582 start_codon:yes stop_codon:yes gene_type:complete